MCLPTLRDDRPTLLGRHRLVRLAAAEPSTEPTWLGLGLGLGLVLGLGLGLALSPPSMASRLTRPLV